MIKRINEFYNLPFYVWFEIDSIDVRIFKIIWDDYIDKFYYYYHTGGIVLKCELKEDEDIKDGEVKFYFRIVKYKINENNKVKT